MNNFWGLVAAITLLFGSHNIFQHAESKTLTLETAADQQVTNQKETSCEEAQGPDISLGFGEEAIFESYSITSTLTHCFSSRPQITCSGTINGVFPISSSEKSIEASFTLPRFDEGQSVITVSLGERSVQRHIYSVPCKDGRWAVSLLSLGSARNLAGKLPMQDLFDGNRSVTLSSENDESKGTRVVIGNGSVSGYVKWNYPNAVSTLYPLAGAKVKLTFLNSWGFIDGYTDASGHFSLAFNNMWAALIHLKLCCTFIGKDNDDMS